MTVSISNTVASMLLGKVIHHFSSTSSMVSGSGTFSVSGRKQAKPAASTAAPPYTTLGRAGRTWKTEGGNMQMFGQNVSLSPADF